MKWQKCQEPTDCGQWVSPNAIRGVIETDYTSGNDGVIYRREWNQQTGERSYAKRLLADDEVFEPWETAPA